MKNHIKLFIFFTLALVTAKCYSQSGNSITITPAITSQSNTFKSLVGQNRVAEFKTLQGLIVTKASTISCSTTITADLTTRTELYNLLGIPALILSPNLVAYYLNANGQACQAVVGIDNNGLILFTQINNCP